MFQEWWETETTTVHLQLRPINEQGLFCLSDAWNCSWTPSGATGGEDSQEKNPQPPNTWEHFQPDTSSHGSTLSFTANQLISRDAAVLDRDKNKTPFSSENNQQTLSGSNLQSHIHRSETQTTSPTNDRGETTKFTHTFNWHEHDYQQKKTPSR